MFVTSSAERAGVLVAVVSGGRPALKQRPTARFLDEFRAAGVADVVWVVNDREADAYERDGAPIVSYPDDWAFEYASTHWMNPASPPERGGFFGAFPGREFACLEAERRGCWAVLQVDDNMVDRYVQRATRGGKKVVADRGGFAFYADILAALSLSTNARMVAPQLSSVGSREQKVIRTGFPYSCFVERVGAGREEWFGPFEDDITHALQYGDRADGATAALTTVIRYEKAPAKASAKKDTSGMRGRYGHDRSKMLQRLQPQAAKVGVRSKTSNGRGEARVFHMMPAGAIRNPIAVTDPVMFNCVKEALLDLMRDYGVAEVEGNREKAAERLAKFEEARG